MIKNLFKYLGSFAIASFALGGCKATPSPELEKPQAPNSDAPAEAMPPPVDAAPPPAWSTDPADELARYYAYLTQAGVNAPEQLLDEKEVQACDMAVHQGSGTFNSGVTKSCTWQQSEMGWVIERVRVDVLENKHDRGTYTESIIAAGGQFDMSVKDIGDQWSAAIDLAAKAADVNVEKKLDLAYQHHMERVLSIASNKNSVYVEANANGGLFQSSTIHLIAYAKLIRVQ